MSTRSLKKWALLLTFWMALHLSSVRAQTFTAPLQASTTSVDFEYRADGTLIARGVGSNATLGSNDQGAGARMLWFAASSAFRAGYVDGTQWNTPSLGLGSAALGRDTVASGPYSTALNINTSASGNYSLATGIFTTAIGTASTALNYGASASGGQSLAAGSWTQAIGPNSTALGTYTTASGFASTTLGHQNVASGDRSLATGFATGASGSFTATFGNGTAAPAYDSFALGACNVGKSSLNTTPSATSWVGTDPLFEIGNGGNGTSWGGDPNKTTTSDALVVYKNGSMTVQGPITAHGGLNCPQQGDLSMGTFTAGTAP
jgi:hypothetical protein